MAPKKTQKIGTRKSELALFQTNLVKKALEKNYEVEVSPIVTRGDKDSRPFKQIQGDGFFTKEIEHSLLSDQIHVAVHSCKDLASMQHIDLKWVAFSERESTRDILIAQKNVILSENPLKLKPNVKIGSSSPRRKSQLEILFPECEVQELRGNVPTRIQRVVEQKYDAIVLAEAGVSRLNLKDFILQNNLEFVHLPFPTAPTQGILAVQASRENFSTLDAITNKDLTEIAYLEKEILALLGGGCHLACGTEIAKEGDRFHLDFYLKSEDDIFDFQISKNSASALLRELFSRLIKVSSPKKVIVAQSMQNVLETAKTFAQNGLEVVPWTFREIKPSWKISDVYQQFEDFNNNAIVFSSQYAVKILLQDLAYLYPPILEKLEKTPIFCVGKKTQKLLKSYGFESTIPKKSEAKSLTLEIEGLVPLIIGTPDSQLLVELKNKGKNYKFLEVYRSIPTTNPLRELPPLSAGDSVVLTSPSIAKDFYNDYKQNLELFKNITIYAFGPTTGNALKKLGIPFSENSNSGSWDELIFAIKSKR